MTQQRTYGNCPTCKAWDFVPHTCLPLWVVWPEDEDASDYHPVRAMDEEDAAEVFAAMWDDEDFELLLGNMLVVFVAPLDKPEVPPQKFEVTGETVPTYTAEEVSRG